MTTTMTNPTGQDPHMPPPTPAQAVQGQAVQGQAIPARAMLGRAVSDRVLVAVPGEATRLAQVLSAAFADNPVSDWLFDGEQDQHHPGFFTAFLHWAFDGGRVDQSRDGTAVAVWIDYTTPPGDLLDAFQEEVTRAVGRHLTRWVALDHATAHQHPTGPHWWLAFLGVLPTSRGRGHAGHLLSAAQLWQRGRSAYLEATSRRLTRFYARRGYELTADIPVPAGPTLHGMHRPPRRGTEL